MSRSLVVRRIAWLLVVPLLADSGQAAPALPGDPCQVQPRPVWSETETWVWNQICVGEIADLNAHFGRDLDPRSPEDWTDERKLSSVFLETILLYDPWRNAIPRQGVRIAGAWFNEIIDLEEANIAHLLGLVDSRFVSDINLRGVRTASALALAGSFVKGMLDLSDARIEGQIYLTGAKVAGTLNMDSADIGKSLLMYSTAEQRAEFADVSLALARIGVQVDLTGAKVGRTLNMDGAVIGESLFIRSAPEQRAEFQDVILRGAEISGQVSLIGAKVGGTLDMDTADIGESLLMRSTPEQRAEFNDVVLLGASIDGPVDLTRAKVAGTLDMNDASIGESLFMGGDSEQRAEFAEVYLARARINGGVNLIGARIAGMLAMDATVVGQILLMHSTPEQRAEFNDMHMRGAKVGGQVDLVGAKVDGTLNMHDASIGGILSMRSTSEHRAEFNDVVLIGASIDGQVDLTGAKVAGVLDLNAARIGESLFMRGDPEQRAEFGGGVDLVFARIGSNLDLRGAALSSLDLTGTIIEGELRLASPFRGLPTWADGGRLNLRNVTVDALQDEPGAWPAELDLDGFTYGRLGGFDVNPNVDVAARGSEWFVEWLARDQPFTPQPYEQLAKVLREMGHGEEANDVLFAGRERARKRAWDDGHWQSWIVQTLLMRTVGYGLGYRYFWALYWVVGLVLIATIVLGITGQNQRNDGKSIGMWYSLDMLLPIIKLREKHYDIDLEGCARYYFYLHKIMGYVLASFLIAGLAGLTG